MVQNYKQQYRFVRNVSKWGNDKYTIKYVYVIICFTAIWKLCDVIILITYGVDSNIVRSLNVTNGLVMGGLLLFFIIAISIVLYKGRRHKFHGMSCGLIYAM